LEVAFWHVRPDGHTIWAVHVCVAIGVSSYLAWSISRRKEVIQGRGAYCYIVRTSFNVVRGSFRWRDDGLVFEAAELEITGILVLSVQDFSRPRIYQQKGALWGRIRSGKGEEDGAPSEIWPA
jgi:hypothetical protein